MNSREWVWRALCDVIRKNTYSNLYLKEHLQEVDEKDRKLASNIFYGTLQNYALCEYAWKRFAKGKVKSKTAILLTMSVYQILFLSRVPNFAIVDEANKIAARKMPESRGMVNAILHKVIETPLEMPEDPVAALALKTSLPEWLLRLWISQYGSKKAYRYAMASLDVLPVVVRRNPMRMSEDDTEKSDRLEPYIDGLYKYTGDHIASDPLYRDGRISVQDPGSYEIARWCEPKAGMKILDLCAAPGTKTMAMAEMSGDKADITALDLHEHRVELIQNDAKRLHLRHIHARQADSTQLEPNPIYDVVLCDAPCSGLGILSRKPDMKINLKPGDLDELPHIQKELLDCAAGQVKDGGALVYSTCTLNTKENEKQVDAFLDRHPEFYLDDDTTIEPDAARGGFYIARLIKGSIDDQPA